MKTLVFALGAIALTSTAALADPGVNWAKIEQGYAHSQKSRDDGAVVLTTQRRDRGERYATQRDENGAARVGRPASQLRRD